MGRLRGPEADIVTDYLERLDRVGRLIGLGPASVREIDERKAGDQMRQGVLIHEAIPSGAVMMALDQRGSMLSSEQLAAKLSKLADGGARDLAIAIGGADGLGEALRREAAHCLSLGPMVWPHALARAMLAEQLYRAATILAGMPYHRA